MGEFYVINDNAEIVEIVDDEQDLVSYWEDIYQNGEYHDGEYYDE